MDPGINLVRISSSPRLKKKPKNQNEIKIKTKIEIKAKQNNNKLQTRGGKYFEDPTRRPYVYINARDEFQFSVFRWCTKVLPDFHSFSPSFSSHHSVAPRFFLLHSIFTIQLRLSFSSTIEIENANCVVFFRADTEAANKWSFVSLIGLLYICCVHLHLLTT